MNVMGGKKKGNEISTFDFNTLYTNFPDQDFVLVLHKLVMYRLKGIQKISHSNGSGLCLHKIGFNSYTVQQI